MAPSLLYFYSVIYPLVWIGSGFVEHKLESQRVATLKKVEPHVVVRYENVAPEWLVRRKIAPGFLERVYGVDVTGVMYGARRNFSIPIEFGDAQIHEMMPALSGFRHLKKLYLPFTRTSDTVVPDLAKLKSLDFLNLQQNGMTSVGVKRLEKLLPRAEIKSFHNRVPRN